MYHLIDEPISVAGVFHQGRFSPRRFVWRKRQLEIKDVTLVSNVRDGGRAYRLYSVVSGGELYRLSHDRQSDVWVLAGVWVENGA